MATLPAESQQHAIMAAITVLIVTLEYLTRGVLSNFAARKLCHAGCGLGIFMLDSPYLPGA